MIESCGYYPEKDTDLEPLRILESKIESDEDFSYFVFYLHFFNARKLMKEGDSEGAKKLYNRAISMAKKHDSLEAAAIMLNIKANMIKW